MRLGARTPTPVTPGNPMPRPRPLTPVLTASGALLLALLAPYQAVAAVLGRSGLG